MWEQLKGPSCSRKLLDGFVSSSNKEGAGEAEGNGLVQGCLSETGV